MEHEGESRSLPHWALTRLWVEVLNGVAPGDSAVLKEYPWAVGTWERVAAQVAATPPNVVIDIPADIDDASISLQSIYPTTAEEEATRRDDE